MVLEHPIFLSQAIFRLSPRVSQHADATRSFVSLILTWTSTALTVSELLHPLVELGTRVVLK